MNPDLEVVLGHLIHQRPVAALGTIHDGAPMVSMVPFASVPAGFVVHVSRLSAHTRDMLHQSKVSLLIMAPEETVQTPLGLPRVSIACAARPVDRDSAEHEQVARAYLSKFPEAEPLLGFGDFQFFVLEPQGARLVAGFAQAMNVNQATILSLLETE